MGSERQVRPGLWAMGAVDDLDWGRMVAVIGSRASTAYGDLVATDFAQDFASQGWHVVTGGGFGIETAALRGALAAGATPPVVWSASSFDRPHPPANAELFERVIAGGGVIVTGADPALGASLMTRSAAVQRDDAMLEQAQAVVLVEAAFRSGAGRAAARTSTPVFGVPGPVTSAASTGVHELIRAGRAQLTTRAAEVLAAVQGAGTSPGLVGAAPVQPAWENVIGQSSVQAAARQAGLRPATEPPSSLTV